MVLIFFKTYIFILYLFYKIRCQHSESFKEIILNKYEYELDVYKYGLTLVNLTVYNKFIIIISK